MAGSAGALRRLPAIFASTLHFNSLFRIRPIQQNSKTDRNALKLEVSCLAPPAKHPQAEHPDGRRFTRHLLRAIYDLCCYTYPLLLVG